MRKFDEVFNAVQRLLFESEGPLSYSTSDGRSIMARGRGSETLFFHFYNEAGEETYILEWQPERSFIPNAIERCASGKLTKYDEMTLNYMKKQIDRSLNVFDEMKQSSDPADISNGRKVDRKFSYYGWTLINSKTGQGFAWSTKDEPGYHIGEDVVEIKPKVRISADASAATEKDYKFTFFDAGNSPRYYVEFEPSGVFAMSNPKWDAIGQIPLKEFKDKKRAETKFLVKFLNDAVMTTVDDLISASDDVDYVASSYPTEGIDSKFNFDHWKLQRGGKDFCYGDRGTQFIKFGKQPQDR